MRRIVKYAAPALGLAIALASCSSFLDSDKAVADPNNPTLASRNQLLVGVQANIFGQQEGPAAMIICEWMQQCAGINGRFVDSYGLYGITPGSFDGPMASLYTAGGLVGIRDVQASAQAAGDMQYKGVAEVMEAITMLWGADIWGDLPYREAVTAAVTPAFDPQQQIYADLQALLTQAIADLGGAGPGPGEFDLIYGGNAARWIRAAHTLKARIHLRLVERNGAAEYLNAANEAALGLASAADDFKALHTGATSERNMWAQFQLTSFGPDLVAGSVLVNIMNAQADPRLPEYFALNALGTYGGYDVSTQATPANQISPLQGSGRTDDVEFAQPLITWEENQLILAEANLLRTGGSAAAAKPFLDAVRAVHGKGAIAVPTLNDIMTEKYILTFQNVEAWSDWKRTCLPARAPARNQSVIPGRLYYGQTEEQTNPNTPASTAQNLSTVRNWNDVAACP